MIRPHFNLFAFQLKPIRERDNPQGLQKRTFSVALEIGTTFKFCASWESDNGPGISIGVVPEIVLPAIAEDDKRSAK